MIDIDYNVTENIGLQWNNRWRISLQDSTNSALDVIHLQLLIKKAGC